ncbi:hypothetical protein GCM10007385_35100 [Tateyamaria omphalii]|nr:hypothetical protein GCM10007385_35100 [Tateyamaria omphalii]
MKEGADMKINLISVMRAGALAAAEIDRIDREAVREAPHEQ